MKTSPTDRGFDGCLSEICTSSTSEDDFLGGGFKYFRIFFFFTPKFGEDFQFDEHIFQMVPTSFGFQAAKALVTQHLPDLHEADT